MALIPYQKLEVNENPFDGAATIYRWLNVTENDTCQPLIFPHKAEKTVQLDVTSWGTGGTIAIKGAILPSLTPETLSDVEQTDLLFNSSSKKIRTILENTYILQPVITAGTSVNITPYIMIQGR